MEILFGVVMWWLWACFAGHQDIRVDVLMQACWTQRIASSIGERDRGRERKSILLLFPSLWAYCSAMVHHQPDHCTYLFMHNYTWLTCWLSLNWHVDLLLWLSCEIVDDGQAPEFRLTPGFFPHSCFSSGTRVNWMWRHWQNYTLPS